jgi:mannose-1-phosphate guanylyltransferase
MRYAVIMAGGSGSRFWPKSTKNKPKQCLSIYSDKPLIQETYERLTPLFPKENIYIITNKEMQEQMSRIVPQANFIIEPVARNTFGCISLACIELLKKDPDATILIQPSDHIYKEKEKYHNYIEQAIGLAKENKIVTLGIKPTFPSTALGYIKYGEPFKWGYKVDTFKEKPNRRTAKEFLKSKTYLWNSGIYIFKASVMLQETKKIQPEAYNIINQIQNGADLNQTFHQLPKISIDFAVSEKTKELAVIPAEMHWDDVGSWDAIERLFDKDEEGNTLAGKYIQIDSKDNIIYSDKLIATVGIKDLAIIQSDKATLVCPKDRVEEVRDIVEELKKKHEYHEFL